MTQHFSPRELRNLDRETLIRVLGSTVRADLVFRTLNQLDAPQSMTQVRRLLLSIKGIGETSVRRITDELSKRSAEASGFIARPGHEGLGE